LEALAKRIGTLCGFSKKNRSRLGILGAKAKELLEESTESTTLVTQFLEKRAAMICFGSP
jgi:hypothetical protein